MFVEWTCVMLVIHQLGPPPVPKIIPCMQQAPGKKKQMMNYRHLQRTFTYFLTFIQTCIRRLFPRKITSNIHVSSWATEEKNSRYMRMLSCSRSVMWSHVGESRYRQVPCSTHVPCFQDQSCSNFPRSIMFHVAKINHVPCFQDQSCSNFPRSVMFHVAKINHVP